MLVLLPQLAIASACGARAGADGTRECDRFTNEDPGPSLHVRVENHDAVAVFFWNIEDGRVPFFTLADPTGTDLPLEGCVTCEDFQESEAICVDAGLPPTIFRLLPGEAFQRSWPGRFYTQEQMPLACFAAPSSGEACQQARPLPVGELTLRVGSWADAPCTQPECACAPAADGTCTLLGSPNPVASETFHHPSTDPIVVVVGPK